MDLQIDSEFSSLIPSLTTEEFEQLSSNIIAEGCRDPLVVWDETGLLLDGHNRYRICTENNIKYHIQKKSLPNRNAAITWIINNQLGRRNLQPIDKVPLAERKRKIMEAHAKEGRLACLKKGITLPVKENLPDREKGQVRDKLAETIGVSGRTYDALVKTAEQGTPELVDAVREKRVGASTAADIADLPKDTQREIVAMGEKEILRKAKEIRAGRAIKRRTERIERILEVSKKNTDIDLECQYPVIYCDPPWKYEYIETESRAIENQYPTMTIEELCKLPIPKLSMDDAVLFMWATSPKLKEAFTVIEAWGFNYRTCAIWDKKVMGMGYYFRQQHELLLISTKGQLPAPEPQNRKASVISSVREEHSKKPDIFYEIIEEMYPELPKIELFCRNPRNGWGYWGNEAQ